MAEKRDLFRRIREEVTFFFEVEWTPFPPYWRHYGTRSGALREISRPPS